MEIRAVDGSKVPDRGVTSRPLFKMDDPIGLTGKWSDSGWWYDVHQKNKPLGIPFEKMMSNGRSLHDPENHDILETIKRYHTAYRNDYINAAADIGLTTAIGRTWKAITIVDYVISTGCTRLQDFSYTQWLKWLKNIKVGARGRTLTADYLYEIFRVAMDLSHLYLTPNEDGLFILDDGFSFVPFTTLRDARAKADELGKEGGQTLDAPREIAFQHIDAAVEYIMYYSPSLFDLDEKRVSQQDKPQTASRNSPGTVAVKLAHTLRRYIGNPVNKFFDGSSLRRVTLARAIGCEDTALYKLRFKKIIDDAERAHRTNSSSDWEILRQHLTTIVNEKRAARTSKVSNRERGIPRLIGMPFTGPTGRWAPWPLLKISNGKNSLDHALTNLWTASYIVLASFMAERIGETLDVDIDCIEEGVDGSYLRNTVYKSTNSEIGTVNVQPCPPVVKEAVRILTRLGHDARTKAGSKRLLFCKHHLGASVPDESTLRKRLKAFGESTGCSTTESGDQWPLTPMELRRFFVTIWVNYHEFGGRFEALRKFLTHASVGTTINYGARRYPGAELSKQQRALTLQVMTSAAFNPIVTSGAAAVLFDKLIRRISVKVASADRIAEWVERRVQNQDIVAFPMPWGYCIWSRFAGATAECLSKDARRSGAARPDNRKCSGTCAYCRQFMTTDVFNDFWAGSLDRHEKILANPKSPSVLKEWALQGVKIARKYLGI